MGTNNKDELGIPLPEYLVIYSGDPTETQALPGIGDVAVAIHACRRAGIGAELFEPNTGRLVWTISDAGAAIRRAA